MRKSVVAGDEEEEEEGETSVWSGKKTKSKPIPLPLFFVSFVVDIKPILPLYGGASSLVSGDERLRLSRVFFFGFLLEFRLLIFFFASNLILLYYLLLPGRVMLVQILVLETNENVGRDCLFLKR